MKRRRIASKGKASTQGLVGLKSGSQWTVGSGNDIRSGSSQAFAGAWISLEKFVSLMGSQDNAAREIGVSRATLNRWIMGHHAPVLKLIRDKLAGLGIRPWWT